VVDIANLSLSHLGDRATLASIDPPEGSAQADHVAQFWPIARDEALAEYDWRFASAIVETAEFTPASETNPLWAYAYALPSDFLVAREIAYADGVVIPWGDNFPEFEIGALSDGQSAFYTQVEGVALRYTRKITDPSKYPPKFVSALSYLLASYLAGPVLKGKTGASAAAAARQAWERLSAKAAVTDANQVKINTVYTSSISRARGAALSRTVENGAYRYELPFWATS
jgi:hypothetical protein